MHRIIYHIITISSHCIVLSAWDDHKITLGLQIHYSIHDIMNVELTKNKMSSPIIFEKVLITVIITFVVIMFSVLQGTLVGADHPVGIIRTDMIQTSYLYSIVLFIGIWWRWVYISHSLVTNDNTTLFRFARNRPTPIRRLERHLILPLSTVR